VCACGSITITTAAAVAATTLHPPPVQVVAAKAAVIARTPQLHTVLGDGALASAEGVSSSCYNLVSGAPQRDAAMLPLSQPRAQPTSGSAARWSKCCSR
jgi:hypothetical protein